MRTVDLNADLGEGLADVDEALMPLISSANIACGLHAGSPDTIARTVALAVEHGVAVGAHPGYDDRQNFGRRPLDLTSTQIRELLIYQLGAINAIARAEGAELRHIKPHGALYNQAERDQRLATWIIDAIHAFDPALRVVGRADSAMQAAAAAVGHPFTAEAFADRRYRPDGSLLPRSEPDSVLVDPERVAEQVRSLVTDGEILASDGSRVRVTFQSLCLHGDTPGAPALAARVRQELEALDVRVCAPSGDSSKSQ
ncbi:MAG TPA: 5-oxoprolinase subunit PxpA [Candidatus Acidoferrum sp.]|nr:5-oxoprolinase subunit PxpA [Candidatus Acidoferrum sp.]